MSTEKQTLFPCEQCGAKITFDPARGGQVCPYCGHETAIEHAYAGIEELDFRAYFEDALKQSEIVETVTVHCDACGAESTKAPNVTADDCPFCGASIVAAEKSKKLIKPQAVLPFRITDTHARGAFKKWLKSLWFAPGSVVKMAREEAALKGLYVPYWTYDSDTVTHYTGQRGEHYWVTETYTTTVNGKSQTRTRRVRKTRWWPASGVVRNVFDDVLIMASQSLPRKYARALEPWDLENLAQYKPEYLSGFVAESYQVDLPEGFALAKERMDPPIRESIRRDIGGDEQRIHSVDTKHFNVTFKHVLLPVWLSAYRYQKKVYRFLVNARTGEVQGERPWSWIKILFAALAGSATVALIAYLVAMYAETQ